VAYNRLLAQVALGFTCLPEYCNAQLLASSKTVVVPKVPMPPMPAMGLDRFRDFEEMDAGGTTYLALKMNPPRPRVVFRFHGTG
jgi:hypothetical protein